MSTTQSIRHIDRKQARQHLAALGYKGGDKVFLRAFFPDTDPRKAEDKGRKAESTSLDQLITQATNFQADGRGIYFVVNGGGHKNDDVSTGRAIFYEHDNLDKAAQIELWKGLGLPEPSLQIDTGGKSIHSYWIFVTPIAIEKWLPLQAELLEFADADRSIKNPSRVMRLAGAWHSSGNQSLIMNNSGKRYTYDELRTIIPTPTKPEATLFQPKPQAQVFSVPEKPDCYENVKLPVPMPVPLLCALGKTNKGFLQGVSTQRNTSMTSLARDLIGTANDFAKLGQATSDDAYTLFIEACRRCSSGGGWDEKEWNQIWKSAEGSNPSASIDKASPDAVENCIKSWYWQEFGDKDRSKRSSNKPSINTKLSMRDAAEQAREILRSERDELTTNIKLEEVRQKAGMGDYAWENKIIKPLKRDMDAERFRLELLALLQMEDPVERCRQIALLAPKYSMGAGTIKEAMAAMKQRTQAPTVQVLTLEELFDSESEAMDWLVSGLLPVGETVLLCALPKVGKSKLAIDLAFSVATGESRFLGQRTKQGRVLLITPDASSQSLKQELTKRGFRKQDTANLHVIPRWNIDQMAVLEAELENFRPDLVVIDSLKKITAGKEISENSAEFADNIIALNDMLSRYRVAGILVHHANKGNDAIGVERARGSTAIVGACWGTWMLDRIPKPDPNNKKKLIHDPKCPKRIFTATNRDSEGTTLNIEFNTENNSWDFISEVGMDEEEAAQQQTHRDRILNVLQANSQKPLSGPEIMELLGVTREQRGSIYSELGRMENKRLISSKPAPGDKRFNLYFLPNFEATEIIDTVTVARKISLPPPPPTPTVPVANYSFESHAMYGLENSQQNSQQIVSKNSECDSYKIAETPFAKSINRIVSNLPLSQGGEGVKCTSDTETVTEKNVELSHQIPIVPSEPEAQPTAPTVAPPESVAEPPPPITLLVEKVKAAKTWAEVEAVWNGNAELKNQIKSQLPDTELKRVGKLYKKAQSEPATSELASEPEPPTETERQEFQELLAPPPAAREFAKRIEEAIGYQSPAVASAINGDLNEAIDAGELVTADVVVVVGDRHFLEFQELVARCPKYFTDLPAPSIEAATKKIS
ncbi:AAA family ATPase [Microcoleus sp. MON1_C1]|uniref:AAA family ATPase n=1 Tax=Microcoleus sp. MON1_C1 TaxID=2818827 RepID=UPI002FD7275A